MQLSGKETILAIAILAFVVIGIITLFKIYFKNISRTKLFESYFRDSDMEVLNSRVKYSEVNAFNWTRQIFLMGLVASITFTLLAFSWTTEYRQEAYGMDLEPIEDNEIDIKRTQHPRPTPPPPPPPSKIVIPEEIIPEELAVSFIDKTIEESQAIEIPIHNTGAVDESGKPGPPLTLPPPPIYIEDEPPILIAEQMPRFPGCEDMEGTRAEKQKCAEKKLLDYIYANLKYPVIAIQNGIVGRSTLRFVVDTEGNIRDIKVLQDPGGGCAAAAAQVINSMNNMPEKWIPGKQRGRAVKVLYTLPIYFKLK
jgi:protein TonB